MLAATVLMADTTPAAATAAATTVAAKPAEAAAAPAATKTEKPRLICRTENVIGSLMPKKTCYSSDELSVRQRDERQNLERIQQMSH
jgi:3-oxoacyl-ACP reductase-like protein